MKRIGLMGGTFDPIHHGHLAAAEQVRYSCGLDQVCFVPSGQPPHKQGASASAADRLEMVRLAIANNPCFTLDDFETRQSGPSYTILTINHFRELLKPDDELFFIMGADAILQITTWKRYQELLTSCFFISMTRPGYPLDEFFREIPEMERFRERFRFIQVPSLAISSTDIRRRVQAGEPITYLVPDAVSSYIERHGLYRTGWRKMVSE